MISLELSKILLHLFILLLHLAIDSHSALYLHYAFAPFPIAFRNSLPDEAPA